MVQVEALQSFEHSGTRRRGDRFNVSEAHAKGLERARLVRVLGEGPTPGNPSTAVGAKSSASPAAQASRQTTVKKSGSGAMKKAARKKKGSEASS